MSAPDASLSPTAADVDDTRSQSAVSNASSSTKRKRAGETKFYAVKAGHRPGIYGNWNDCQNQVKGFKGALYKSFSTAAEAHAFLTGSGAGSKNAPSKFYAVQSGRLPGVYTDWGAAQKQVVGWTRPKYKSFSTRAEAEDYLKEGNGKVTGESATNVSVDADSHSESTILVTDKSAKTPATKKQKKSGQDTPTAAADALEGPYAPGTGPLPEGAEDGFDPRIMLNPETGDVEYKTEDQLNSKKKVPTGEKGGMLVIYTDGSSLGNGALGAVAGVGVFFGPQDSRNVSESLVGPRQTNQRAELTAIQRALDIAPLHRDVQIFSDSNYAINCVTVWFHSWRKNNWHTSAKKPVENKDLVEAIVARLEERDACGVRTKFQWLKGHANDPGNIAADALAVSGARNAAKDIVNAAAAAAAGPPPAEAEAQMELEEAEAAAREAEER